MKDKQEASRLLSRRQALALLALTPPLALGLASNEPVSTSRGAGTLRLALLSFWHVHALDYAHQARANPATTIMAIWDEQPARGRQQAVAFGVPFYEQLDDLLSHAPIDAVIVDTPTTMHRNVMMAAARAGKHIFTEKVLAPTLHECHEIVTAVNQAGVRLMVSLPRLYAGSTLAIKAILNKGLLGDLSQVRVRLCHDGAVRTPQYPQGWLPPYFFNPQQTAGGAMIDLGSHPMYLVREFLGVPESVQATYANITKRAVEDNAVAVLKYPQGMIGIAETGFVTQFSPFSIEAHGTKGSLLYGIPAGQLLLHSSLVTRAANTWITWTDIPPDQPTAFQQWLSHIQHATNATENIQTAVDLGMLMEAANLSAKEQRAVRLDTLPR